MVAPKEHVIDFLKFYLADILFGISLAIIAAGFNSTKPYDRFFLERDPTLSFPLVAKEEIPVSLVIVLCGIIPFILIVLTQILLLLGRRRYPNADRPSSTFTHYLLMPYLALIESIGISIFLSQAIKIFVGRKRPNFFAMCNYKGYRTALETGNFTAYNLATVPGAIGSLEFCLETDGAMVRESQFSFPSGHSTSIFAGLTLLMLYWLHVAPRFFMKGVGGTHHPARILPIKMALTVILMISASFVAGTRTRDYWHNFDDILSGSILGFACAVFSFWVNLSRIEEETKVEGKISGDP